MRKNTSGFTIVELLIVIVVIAILATISIVAYTNIQQRAVNSKIVSDATQAAKLLEVYKAANDSYPTISGTAACIGEGFIDYTGDSIGDCWDTLSGVRFGVQSALNAALKMVGSLPNSPSCVPYNAACFTGPVYVAAGASNPSSIPGPYIRYWVYGATCPIGQKVWGSTPVSSASGCAILLSS